MDYTPIFGWLTEGLHTLVRLAEVIPPDETHCIVRGLTGYINLLHRYSQEHAPVTPDQAIRLAELSQRLVDVIVERELPEDEGLKEAYERLNEIVLGILQGAK